ncbi:MAG TPA: DUF721 domain-containing protein [Rhizomicrobium sp.]
MTRGRKQLPDSTTADAPQRRARIAAIAADATELGRAAFDRAGFRDPTLVLRWREIAGSDVANIAQPLRISESPAGTVLTLRADPAAAVFLQHESRALCARINAYLGRAAIERLRFVPGEITPGRTPPLRNNPQKSPPGSDAAELTGGDRLANALHALAHARRGS